MSELDAKIRRVLETVERNALMADSDIAVIKKAFEDAGWEPNDDKWIALHQHLKELEDLFRNHRGLMTGREWYDKFIETLEPSGTTAVFLDGSTPDNFTITWNIVDKAAKLAADLTEDEQL